MQDDPPADEAQHSDPRWDRWVKVAFLVVLLMDTPGWVKDVADGSAQVWDWIGLAVLAIVLVLLAGDLREHLRQRSSD